MTCEYCEGSPMPGIHCPTNFDDREECCDGMVFVAKCDACGIYGSDMKAAEAVREKTGWPIIRSLDERDDVDPKEREAKKGSGYFRPYFAVRIADAEREVG